MTPKKASLLRTADVPPLDVDGVRALGVGTALWIVALLVLLPFRDRLEADGNTWWLWTCAAGIGLGLLGELYCLLRRRRFRSGGGRRQGGPQRRRGRERPEGSGDVVEPDGVQHRAQ